MRGALRSVAPVLGEPTPFAPMIPPESTLDMSAPQTPHPSTPSSPRAITARPPTAQPITARPLTAQPLQQPLAPTTPAPPLAPTIPLAGSASHYPQAQTPASAVATGQTSTGNRTPLYITLSAVIALLVLAAVGFGAKRWWDARSSESSAAAPADTSTPAPATPAGDTTPAPVTPATHSVAAADPVSRKSTTAAIGKPRAVAPQAAQSPAPQQETPQQQAPQPTPATPQQPSAATQPPSNAQADHRAAEQSARKTVASVAQLAALEHEEFDELEARDNKVNARIATLPQQPGADVAASQQRARNELALAQKALQIADVQNAQKYMEQADADITKIEKILGH
jgi:hypothetical protein